MSLAGGLRELLRPPSHRGPLIAAGAVVLTVGLASMELRLAHTLAPGVQAAVLLVCGALIYWLGAQAANEHGAPPSYQSVLLVSGLAVGAGGLLATAHALGGELTSPGTLVWTSALAAALALWPALERNSAVCLLLACGLTTLALLAAWDWIFGTSATAHRWILVALAALFVLGALALREPAPRHAEQLTNAAGLAVAAVALPAVLGSHAGLPGFWEVVVLGAGFGLVASAALDRSPGPAYVGVLDLALFVLVVGREPGATLYWWPLVLLAVGAVMLLVGLRPRRPLPPEPPAYRAGEAPLAARAAPPTDEIVVRVRED